MKMAPGTTRGASPVIDSEHQSKRPRLKAEDTQIPNPSGIEVQGSSSDCNHSIMSEDDLIEEQMRLPIEYVRSYDNEINYKNKLVLAPMVRTGSCEYTHLLKLSSVLMNYFQVPMVGIILR